MLITLTDVLLLNITFILAVGLGCLLTQTYLALRRHYLYQKSITQVLSLMPLLSAMIFSFDRQNVARGFPMPHFHTADVRTDDPAETRRPSHSNDNQETPDHDQ